MHTQLYILEVLFQNVKLALLISSYSALKPSIVSDTEHRSP